jgi:hypothetical protein
LTVHTTIDKFTRGPDAAAAPAGYAAQGRRRRPDHHLIFLSEGLKAKATGKQTSTREMTPTGVWSLADARQATAARGKAYTGGFYVQFITVWKTLEPMRK